MCDLVHNFAAWKRKRDASFKQVVDAVPEVAGGEGPDMQAIVILGLPKIRSNDQLDLENATLVESREASPTPATIQVFILPNRLLAGQRGPCTPGMNIECHGCMTDCS